MLLSPVFTVLVLVASLGASCWLQPAKDGAENCEYKGITIARGEEYTKTTPLYCFRCKCLKNGSLSCCSEGTKIRIIPPTCKVLQRGCNQVAVNRDDEGKNCTAGPVLSVI